MRPIRKLKGQLAVSWLVSAGRTSQKSGDLSKPMDTTLAALMGWFAPRRNARQGEGRRPRDVAPLVFLTRARALRFGLRGDLPSPMSSSSNDGADKL